MLSTWNALGSKNLHWSGLTLFCCFTEQHPLLVSVNTGLLRRDNGDDPSVYCIRLGIQLPATALATSWRYAWSPGIGGLTPQNVSCDSCVRAMSIAPVASAQWAATLAMGGFYQGKGGGKAAAPAAAPAAEGVPGALKRKLQALGYPETQSPLGAVRLARLGTRQLGQLVFVSVRPVRKRPGPWPKMTTLTTRLKFQPPHFISWQRKLGSVSLDGQAYMKVILWLEEDNASVVPSLYIPLSSFIWITSIFGY